jgi:hypothetical protein
VLSAMSHVAREYEDLRQAANRLAVVEVVTQFQHWIDSFVKKVNMGKPSGGHRSKLMNQLAHLENFLGPGPVTLAEFEALVNVRDSIIHANSEAAWYYKEERTVAECYRDAWGGISFSEEHLEDAIKNTIQQVSWYDLQICRAKGQLRNEN